MKSETIVKVLICIISSTDDENNRSRIVNDIVFISLVLPMIRPSVKTPKVERSFRKRIS